MWLTIQGVANGAGWSASEWMQLAETIGMWVIPIAVGVVGKLVKDSLREREVNLEWVRAALEILRDTDQHVLPMRPWAINVVNEFSDIEFDEDTQQKLLTGEARMANPTYRMPSSIGKGRVRAEMEDRLRESMPPQTWDLPIHDANVGFLESGDASVLVIPCEPGKPHRPIFTDEDHGIIKQVKVQAPFDWSRKDEDAYMREVAELLSQRLHDEMERMGFTNQQSEQNT